LAKKRVDRITIKISEVQDAEKGMQVEKIDGTSDLSSRPNYSEHILVMCAILGVAFRMGIVSLSHKSY
jgi:hypothetical protein